MNLVLDSSALLALLRQEEGGPLVRDLMDDPSNRSCIHAVNLCEVYYDSVRERGESTANIVLVGLLSTDLQVREDMDPVFWRQAGLYKANMARISLADCFCATLANRMEAEVVTADHREFDKVAEQGLCRVRFVR